MEDKFSELEDAAAKNDCQKMDLIFNHTANKLWQITHVAAEKGNLNVIKYLAQKWPLVIEKKNADGETVAHVAAKFGRTDIIEYIEQKHSPCTWEKNMNNETYIHIAARFGRLKIIQCAMKLHAGKCILAKNVDGETPLHIAVRNGHLSILQYLIDGGYFYSYSHEEIMKDLFKVATENGHVNIIRYLLEKYYLGTDGRLRLAKIAVENGHLEIFFILAEDEYMIRSYGSENDLLHKVFKKNITDPDVLKSIYHTFSHLVEHTNEKGDILANVAAEERNMNVIRYLAEHAPSYYFKKGSAWDYELFLFKASKANVLNSSILKILSEKGIPSWNITDRYDNNILHLSVKVGNLDVIWWLGEREPGMLQLRNLDGDSVLHLAVKGNKTDVSTFKWLVEKAESLLSQSNADGKTPAYLAVENKRTDVVQYLLQERPSAFNDTTLDLAVERNFVDWQQMKLLVKNGVSPGKNITSIVAKKGDLDFTRYLVENIPSVYAVGDVLTDCARYAVSANQINIVEYLLERYPDIFAQRLEILSQLSDANNITRMIKCLAKACSRKISHWDRRNFRSRVTHLMVRKGNKEVLKYFLEKKKWDVNIMNEKKEPPVFTAVRYHKHDILQYLASERNANLTVLNLANENILFLAVEECDLYPIKYVLDEMKIPFDLEWRNNEGNTLLHIIFKNGSVDNDFDILKYFVEDKGVNVNSRNLDGSTALHMAARLNKYDLCDYLLEHGADPKLKNSEGYNFHKLLHFSSPWKEETGNEGVVDQEIRKRRSVDLFHPFTRSQIPVSYSLADQSLHQSFHPVGGKTDDVNFKIHTPIIGFLGFLTMAKYFNKKNTNGKFRERAAFQSPAATMIQRMDLRAIGAVNTPP